MVAAKSLKKTKYYEESTNQEVSKYSELTRALPLTEDPMRNQIILDYSSLIKFIAQKLAVRLPSNIDLDDLFSAGVIGLMDAIDKYDPTRDNKFKTYAEFRIRGAMLDELRNQDWVPRSVREMNKKDERAKVELEHKLGRPASGQEIAQHLDLSFDDYNEKLGRTKVSLLSIEDLGGISPVDKNSILELLDLSSTKNPFSILKNKGVKEIGRAHV